MDGARATFLVNGTNEIQASQPCSLPFISQPNQLAAISPIRRIHNQSSDNENGSDFPSFNFVQQVRQEIIEEQLASGVGQDQESEYGSEYENQSEVDRQLEVIERLNAMVEQKKRARDKKINQRNEPPPEMAFIDVEQQSSISKFIDAPLRPDFENSVNCFTLPPIASA